MISNMLRFSPSFFEGFDELYTPAFASQRNLARVFPQVNMGITDKSVEVYLFAPGMDASALDVTLEKNLLSQVPYRTSGEQRWIMMYLQRV